MRSEYKNKLLELIINTKKSLTKLDIEDESSSIFTAKKQYEHVLNVMLSQLKEEHHSKETIIKLDLALKLINMIWKTLENSDVDDNVYEILGTSHLLIPVIKYLVVSMLPDKLKESAIISIADEVEDDTDIEPRGYGNNQDYYDTSRSDLINTTQGNSLEGLKFASPLNKEYYGQRRFHAPDEGYYSEKTTEIEEIQDEGYQNELKDYDKYDDINDVEKQGKPYDNDRQYEGNKRYAKRINNAEKDEKQKYYNKTNSAEQDEDDEYDIENDEKYDDDNEDYEEDIYEDNPEDQTEESVSPREQARYDQFNDIISGSDQADDPSILNIIKPDQIANNSTSDAPTSNNQFESIFTEPDEADNPSISKTMNSKVNHQTMQQNDQFDTIFNNQPEVQHDSLDEVFGKPDKNGVSKFARANNTQIAPQPINQQEVQHDSLDKVFGKPDRNGISKLATSNNNRTMSQAQYDQFNRMFDESDDVDPSLSTPKPANLRPTHNNPNMNQVEKYMTNALNTEDMSQGYNHMNEQRDQAVQDILLQEDELNINMNEDNQPITRVSGNLHDNLLVNYAGPSMDSEVSTQVQEDEEINVETPDITNSEINPDGSLLD